MIFDNQRRILFPLSAQKTESTRIQAPGLIQACNEESMIARKCELNLTVQCGLQLEIEKNFLTTSIKDGSIRHVI